MIQIEIPGFGKLSLKNAVFDFNGTLAIDGQLIAGVKDSLTLLANHLEIFVLTADTFGLATGQMEGTPCQLKILSASQEAEQKERFIKQLGAPQTCALGNGNNDCKMLRTAALGIAVVQEEGCSIRALQAADLMVTTIGAGIDLLLNPLRLKATLRF